LESEWRWNVWKYGIANNWWIFFGQQTTMCARVLSGPLAGKLVGAWPFGAGYPIYENLGDIQGWVITSVGTIPAAHPHFPYGLDVEPD